MTKPTDKQLSQLGAAFDIFTRRYKLVDAVGLDKPLNEVDKQTLFFVADHPSCGPTDIARFLTVPNTTISSATDRLVKQGLLNRDRVAGDRRAVALHLSSRGEAAVEAQLQAYRDLYRMMLGRLSAAERNQFIRLIDKIAYYDYRIVRTS